MNDIYIKNNSKVKLDNTQVYGSKKTQKYILGLLKMRVNIYNQYIN